MASGTKNGLYERITERVLAALREGVAPWHKPWRASVGADGTRVWQPRNAVTGRPYRGVNVLLLGMNGFDDGRFLTFNQARAAGGSVRKGERGTEIVFWKILDHEKEDSAVSHLPILRAFHVFNVSQVDGLNLPPLHAGNVPEPTIRERIAAAEAVASGFVGGPSVLHGGNKACYAPCLDRVTMPLYEQFECGEAYYATLFHELTHATGHATRLNREGVSWQAGEPRTLARYGREELIAEMGAAFLCAEVGINARLDQSAAYLDNWISAIQADHKAVIVAAGAAQKATDFILNRRGTADSGDAEKEANFVASLV